MSQFAFIFIVVFCLNAQQLDSLKVNQWLNSWHKAASVSDSITFFSALSEDAIYLGTDAKERWTKAEFIAWSRPYFKRKTAWNLVPIRRHLYTHGPYIWFEEFLQTGMGPCRASGIILTESNGFKILHYHLAITIPNEHVDSIKKLIETDK